jgi:hypothetical protein
MNFAIIKPTRMIFFLLWDGRRLIVFPGSVCNKAMNGIG